MFLPRSLISHLYLHLLRTHHPLSPPVLLLVALEPDALCACRILTALLKRDYIPHKIQPVSGYGDLADAGERLVRPMRTNEGGSGGVVVCVGLGGLVDLGAVLGLDLASDGEDNMGAVEVWVLDARRPWNLGNVFGGGPLPNAVAASTEQGVEKGRIKESYKPGRGGIIVFDDGDIDEELTAEQEAYTALEQMPEVEDDGEESDGTDSASDEEEADDGRSNKKRKSWSDRGDEENEVDENERPWQRRRGNSVRPWCIKVWKRSIDLFPVELNTVIAFTASASRPTLDNSQAQSVADVIPISIALGPSSRASAIS